MLNFWRYVCLAGAYLSLWTHSALAEFEPVKLPPHWNKIDESDQQTHEPAKKDETHHQTDDSGENKKSLKRIDYTVADWLNSINIGSFFDYGNKYIFNNDQCFVFFDSLENLSLWGEPYGFHSHYRSSQEIDFKLTSIGLMLGGKAPISGQINVGGGMGYFHSSFHPKQNLEKKKRINGSYNGLFFGPSIQYLFSEGSVGFALIGIGNFYGGDKRIEKSQSWDIDLRIETEYNLEPFADFFIKELTIHPFLRIDYLNVFTPHHRDKIKGAEISSKHSSFFYSKLGMRFEKIMFCHQAGIITSNIDLGWINMSPLSGHAQPSSKNQAALGFELVGVYKSQLVVGLEYQAAVGADAPLQTGRLRFEWNW